MRLGAKQIIHFLCLLVYLQLFYVQISANEFEEEHNTYAISSQDFIDFDNDGHYDFENDSDEERSSKISIPHMVICALMPGPTFHHFHVERRSAYSLFKETLHPYEFKSEIFQPPKHA